MACWSSPQQYSRKCQFVAIRVMFSTDMMASEDDYNTVLVEPKKKEIRIGYQEF